MTVPKDLDGRPVPQWEWEWGWIAFAVLCAIVVAVLLLMAVVDLMTNAEQTAALCSEAIGLASELAEIDVSILEAHDAAHSSVVFSEGP
mgnify:CR=1 FL=1